MTRPTDKIIRTSAPARAALVAPPRNCDRYKTHAEALAAWRDIDPRVAGPFDEWLFAPETKGATDGSK